MADGSLIWIEEAIPKLPEDLLMPDEYQGW